MKSVKDVRKPEPWRSAKYAKADVLALQALEKGVANELQQQRVLYWIIDACGLTEQSFIPLAQGGDANGRVDAFIEGKRHIGRQIRKLLMLNADVVSDNETQNVE